MNTTFLDENLLMNPRFNEQRPKVCYHLTDYCNPNSNFRSARVNLSSAECNLKQKQNKSLANWRRRNQLLFIILKQCSSYPILANQVTKLTLKISQLRTAEDMVILQRKQ
jgi:hypothetical protein